MKPKSSSLFAAVLITVFLALVTPANSALITFNFLGTNPGLNSPWNTGTTIDPNASTTGFALGAGVNGSAANNRFNAVAWDTGGTVSTALAGNDYFGFVLTINPNFAANLNSAAINFTLQSSWTGTVGNGPKNYALFSSIAGFTAGSELQSGTITSAEVFTFTFPSSGFDNLTGNLEFRVYGWNAASSAGTMSANAFSVNGSISAVPEPAHYGTFSALGLLLLVGGRLWVNSFRAGV